MFSPLIFLVRSRVCVFIISLVFQTSWQLPNIGVHGYASFVEITIRSFLYSWLITRVTRRVPHVEQELFTSGFKWGSCRSIFNFLYSILYIIVLFLLTIVLSLRLWFMTFDYPFDIFKRFLQWWICGFFFFFFLCSKLVYTRAFLLSWWYTTDWLWWALTLKWRV